MPSAAASGSSIKTALPAPALRIHSRIFLFSKFVSPAGIVAATVGLKILFLQILSIKFLKSNLLFSRFEIPPERSGRTSLIASGHLPVILSASLPAASTLPVSLSRAKTAGSHKTTPLPSIAAVTFPVPISRPILRPTTSNTTLSKNFLLFSGHIEIIIHLFIKFVNKKTANWN